MPQQAPDQPAGPAALSSDAVMDRPAETAEKPGGKKASDPLIAGLSAARLRLAAQAEAMLAERSEADAEAARAARAETRAHALKRKLDDARAALARPAALRDLPQAKELLRRHLPARPTSAALKAAYEAAGLHEMADTFVLYRIIGNDLYPRHRKGQSRSNVAFILENEPELEACEKRWVINRIVDGDEREAIIALLERHRQAWIEIPFDWDEYDRIDWDVEAFDGLPCEVSREFDQLDEKERGLVAARLRQSKNNYVMNNNGARNAALADGLDRAKWVLPWDGNCFVTVSAWRDIREAVTGRPWLKHFLVPMARITDNASLLDPGFAPEAAEEPQILFRCDSTESFDARHPYGRRPKVDLFWRLGVPGPWDKWKYYPWDMTARGASAEAHQFGHAGWVARLASGQSHLEQSDARSFQDRGLARAEAIVSTLDHLDAQRLYRRYDRDNLVSYDEARLDQLARARYGWMGAWRSHVLDAAREALGRGPYSVTQKTSLPPSGDIHDYWHPAPYWHPDPSKPDGLPYIRRDGQRVPGTVMYEPDSAQYDRTRLQMMFDDTTALALGWAVSGDIELARHGAKLVRAWFLNAKTAMNPHLTYSQVRMGHNNNEGAQTGVIEMKDLYYVLDAVRLLERSGAFTRRDRAGFEDWLTRYLDWLTTSTQGQRERSSPNNHGIMYDLQVAAIHAYLGNMQGLIDTFCASRQRLFEHFNPDGFQPHEMDRTISAHYCCFNLQGWVSLANLAKACGDGLWDFALPDGRSIRKGLEWALAHADAPHWPFEQIEPFDAGRFVPLRHAAAIRAGQPSPLDGLPDGQAVKPVFHPHDGIKPYWAI